MKGMGGPLPKDWGTNSGSPMAVRANVCKSSSGPGKTTAFAYKAVELRPTTPGTVRAPGVLGQSKGVEGGL